jgi:hypothetical protein
MILTSICRLQGTASKIFAAKLISSEFARIKSLAVPRQQRKRLISFSYFVRQPGLFTSKFPLPASCLPVALLLRRLCPFDHHFPTRHRHPIPLSFAARSSDPCLLHSSIGPGSVLLILFAHWVNLRNRLFLHKFILRQVEYIGRFFHFNPLPAFPSFEFCGTIDRSVFLVFIQSVGLCFCIVGCLKSAVPRQVHSLSR